MKIIHKKKEFIRPELEGNLIADDEESKFNAWKASKGKLVEDESLENNSTKDNSEFLDGTKEAEQPVLTTVNNTDTNGVEVNPEEITPEQVQLPDNAGKTDLVDTNVIPADTSTENSENLENTKPVENVEESKEETDISTITALKDLIVSLTSKIDDMDNKISSLNSSKEDTETNNGNTEDNLLPEEPSTEPEVSAETSTETSNTMPVEPTKEPENTESDEDLDAEGEDVDKTIPKTEMFKSFCKKNMQLSEKSDFIIGKLIRGKAYQLEEKILSIVNSKIRSAIDEQKQEIRINNTKK